MTEQTTMAAAGKRVFRILLAEDVKLNQILTQRMLSKSGYQIDVVDDGKLALDAVQQADYDVILMDVQMPVMDGIAATQAIRALPPAKSGVRIIALTAKADIDAEDELLAAGMDDYIAKPINFDILFSKLSALASARGL